jgi:hypothetical protein
MKRNFITIAVLTLACLLGGGNWVAAQYAPGTPYAQPQPSAYLNLLRGGATPGFNYFSLTRPQLDFRGGIVGLQQQVQQNQQLVTGLEATRAGNQAAVTTGQPFGFMTDLGFFQNQNQFAATGGVGAGVGAAGGDESATGRRYGGPRAPQTGPLNRASSLVGAAEHAIREPRAWVTGVNRG